MKEKVRLVRRIHEGWRANGSARRPSLAPREIAELQARIDRLQLMGDCFTHVTLSSDVRQPADLRANPQKKGWIRRHGSVTNHPLSESNTLNK